ncbi:MAG: CDP-alcohol phosphatidyltransferase family protein [Acidobacteriota bacterium]|nr:CDP-alcohol phosphatidyltransferase family protein [Acidobacteriota bacterium]MED5376529.1 CDP-alcohol phosphatidyltransferase family protein [Acidobacteriota bacterium]|tara:strand:- start:430 stop:1185 length:756 start_codon:yes stop_codon:yes gene_type:complete
MIDFSRECSNDQGWQANVRLAGPDLAAGLLATLAAALLNMWIFDLSKVYFLGIGFLYVVMAGLVLASLPVSFGALDLGSANRVTLGRAALVLPLAGLTIQAPVISVIGYWWVILVATVAMILDGVDGWVARRRGPTVFGARFDMELDALLLLVLSVMVWQSGKVGLWVSLIGVLRYLFVFASWLWPSLAAKLPASRRRKTICVVQGVVLLVCLGPIIPATMASIIAVAALAMLMSSFAVDVQWLLRPGKRY